MQVAPPKWGRHKRSNMQQNRLKLSECLTTFDVYTKVNLRAEDAVIVGGTS